MMRLLGLLMKAFEGFDFSVGWGKSFSVLFALYTCGLTVSLCHFSAKIILRASIHTYTDLAIRVIVSGS